MTAPSTRYFITADSRRASVFSFRQVAPGRCQVDQVRTLFNSHESEHDRGRPGTLGRMPGGLPQALGQSRQAEEEVRRFAHDVGSWLRVTANELRLGPLTVFAPPRFLGVLRAILDKNIAFDLRQGELTHLRAAELASHPAVVAAMLDGRGLSG
jgi:protein required for attachment to host cells